jgi:hypothetical protein
MEDESRVMDCSNCGAGFWYDKDDKAPRFIDLCDLCNIEVFSEDA